VFYGNGPGDDGGDGITMAFSVWREAIGRQRRFFVGVFVLSTAGFLFLMNIVSIYGIVYYGEILVPDGLGIDAFVFLFLFSFLVALSLTLHKQKLSGAAGVGVAGTVAGLFTSACPICAPLVLSLLGVPAAAALFPLGGWEMRAVSLLLLLASVWMVSGKNTCDITVQKNTTGES